MGEGAGSEDEDVTKVNQSMLFHKHADIAPIHQASLLNSPDMLVVDKMEQ